MYPRHRPHRLHYVQRRPGYPASLTPRHSCVPSAPTDALVLPSEGGTGWRHSGNDQQPIVDRPRPLGMLSEMRPVSPLHQADPAPPYRVRSWAWDRTFSTRIPVNVSFKPVEAWSTTPSRSARTTSFAFLSVHSATLLPTPRLLFATHDQTTKNHGIPTDRFARPAHPDQCHRVRLPQHRILHPGPVQLAVNLLFPSRRNGTPWVFERGPSRSAREGLRLSMHLASFR